MDAALVADTVRFYLRQYQRIKLNRQDKLILPASVDDALWDRAETAAARLQRLAALQPLPIPVERRRRG